jgi:hypothetical protein
VKRLEEKAKIKQKEIQQKVGISARLEQKGVVASQRWGVSFRQSEVD